MEGIESEMEHDVETVEYRETYRRRAASAKELGYSITPSPVDPTIYVRNLHEVRIKSINSTQTANIVFWNKTEGSVRAFWIDYNGHEVIFIIPKGEKKRYQTYATHPWIIRDVKQSHRLVINSSEVIFAREEPVEAVITQPPLLEWNDTNHRYFPPSFQETVQVFLLCYTHHRRRMQYSKEHHLGHLPHEIVKMILIGFSKSYPTNQTLLKGFHAGPDLNPVELPVDYPIETLCYSCTISSDGSSSSHTLDDLD